MPTVVDVPGLGEVEFPDGMSDQQISDAIKAQLPAQPQGMRGGALDALLTGARDPIDALAQLAPRGLQGLTSLGGLAPNPVSNFFGEQAQSVDALTRQNEAQYQAAREAQGRGGFDAMRLAGNVVSPANLAVGGAAGLATRGLSTPARIAASVPTGAAFGALQPVTTGEDFGSVKAQQMGAGAALGPLAELGLAGVQRALKPNISPQAQTLMNEGVQLTPGQILGGATQRVEDAATSIPFVGDVIGAAKNRSLETFNKAAAQRALTPIGEKIPANISAGRELVGYTRQKLGDAYDKLIPQLKFNPDTQYASELQNIMAMTSSPAFAKGEQFRGILQQRLFDKITPQGNMSGETFKVVEEGLKKDSQRYLSSPDPDQRALGEALGEVLRSTRQALARGNPNKAAELQKINEGYAAYSRIRRAASSTGAAEGVFTPAQFQQAVKMGDSSVGRGSFARGAAFLQDLGDAAKTVLPSKVNDSGTAGRLLTAATLGGGAAIAPNALLAPFLASLAYTQPGQRVLNAAITGAPQQRNALSQYVTQYGQSAIPALLPFSPVGQQ